MDNKKPKVLIVEDATSVAKILAMILFEFDIVGIARSGREALRMVGKTDPDIITMDVLLPDTNGVELTKTILSTRSTPIIIISSLVTPDNQRLVFDALLAGAYDVVAKSKFITAEGKSVRANKLISLVKAAANRSMKSRKRLEETKDGKISGDRRTQRRAKTAVPSPKIDTHKEIIVIGASTGGPAALAEILPNLPADFPFTILVGQHMADGFIEGCARWLNSLSPITVKIASDREEPKKSTAYFAPSAHNLQVTRSGRLALTPCEPNKACPSIDILLQSVAKTCAQKSVCLLLTGMGADGAKGLLAAKTAGAITVAQDEQSSVIYGMPREAAKLGAAEHVLSLKDIAPWLVKLSKG